MSIDYVFSDVKTGIVSHSVVAIQCGKLGVL